MNYQAMFRYSGAELTNFKTKKIKQGKRGKFECRNLIGRNKKKITIKIKTLSFSFFNFQRSDAWTDSFGQKICKKHQEERFV